MKTYHRSKSFIKQATIAVANLSVSEDFYNQIIKLETINRTKDQVILGSQGVPLITLVESLGVHIVQEGLYHIAFLLKDEVQLASWISSNMTYPFLGASHHGVSKAIYFEDPDGNGIEMYADTDEHTWDINGKEIRMESLPLNVNQLLEKAEVGSDYDIVIGHIHLQTRDVDKAAYFYQNLGFDVTYDMRNALFMSFNQYHHHIAFNQWHRLKMDDHNKDNIDLLAYEIWYENQEQYNHVVERLDHLDVPYDKDGDFIVVKDPLNIEVKLTY